MGLQLVQSRPSNLPVFEYVFEVASRYIVLGNKNENSGHIQWGNGMRTTVLEGVAVAPNGDEIVIEEARPGKRQSRVRLLVKSGKEYREVMRGFGIDSFKLLDS